MFLVLLVCRFADYMVYATLWSLYFLYNSRIKCFLQVSKLLLKKLNVLSQNLSLLSTLWLYVLIAVTVRAFMKRLNDIRCFGRAICSSQIFWIKLLGVLHEPKPILLRKDCMKPCFKTSRPQSLERTIKMNELLFTNTSFFTHIQECSIHIFEVHV